VWLARAAWLAVAAAVIQHFHFGLSKITSGNKAHNYTSSPCPCISAIPCSGNRCNIYNPLSMKSWMSQKQSIPSLCHWDRQFHEQSSDFSLQHVYTSNTVST
jgi:hypothetical protein